MSDLNWPLPNFGMLNSALTQSGWAGPAVDASNWAAVVKQRLSEMDWPKIAPDVRPFLERPEEAALLTEQNLARLLTAHGD